MVAIFTGLGPGTERGSGSVLGGAGLLGSGTLGRSGEQVLLNAATGNLVIQQKDEMLVGRGPDAAIGRTYNSLGDLSDDNGDNWRQSTDRRIYGLTGTVNSWGSTVKRVSADGSEVVYTWDGAAYVATDGAGAYDRITYDGTWRWTDGDSRTIEVYGFAYGGRNYLTQLTDTSGNSLAYSYDAGTGRLTRVTTANGEYVQYGWTGNAVTTITSYAGNTVTRTRYAYDSANRLSSVTVDLTPEDNSVADGKIYVTTYTYDGTSKRVATITETDGSRLAIAYDALGRVKTLTQTVASDVTRATAIDYYAGYTIITDAAGQVTRLDYALDNFAQPLEGWPSDNVIKTPATIDGAPAIKYSVQDGSQWSAIYQGFEFAAGETISFGLTLQAVGSITSQNIGLYSHQTGWGSSGISSARIVSGPGTIEQVSGGLWRVVGLSTTQGTRIEITRTYDQAGSGNAYFYVDNPLFRPGAALIAANATLLRSATATSLSQMDLGTWYYDGVTRQQAGTIDGAAAYQFTATQSGAWAGTSTTISAKAGDAYTMSLSLKAIGDSTTQDLGLYGHADGSAWGPNGTSTARILSGPGTIVQLQGGLFRVSGLSTTEVTRIEVTRVYEVDEAAGAYLYIDRPAGSRAGASLIAGAVKLTKWLVPSAQGGQLLKITAPAAEPGAAQQVTQFTYNENGDLASVIDASGNATNFAYDGNGNVLTATDRLGNTVTRTYDTSGGRNLLLTETRTGSDASGAAVQHTTRYAYDAAGRLRFTVSAEGDVIEHRYDSYGQEWLSLTYTEQRYDVSGLAPSAALTAAQLGAWVAGLGDPTAVQQVQFVYDARGNLSERVDYGASVAPGNATTGSGYTDTYYGYDQAGQLLSRMVLSQNTERFVYDGLGRIIASTDLNGGTTSIMFNDAAGKTIVTAANGLVQTSTYNKAGELIAYTDAGDFVTAGTTTYEYDQLGRVRQKTDANGLSFYYAYDQAGRKIAEVDHWGEMVEYRYDANDRVVATVRYFNTVSAATLAALGDPNADVTAAAIRPPSHASDLWTWQVYDKEDRVVEAIDGTGGVTAYEYDGSNRLIRTTDYAARLAAGMLASLRTAPPATPLLPAATSQDRVSRTFYDKDGRIIGALDSAGYLSRIVYNAAGEKVEETAFAIATNAAYRAGGSFAQLIASVGASTADRTTRYVYDKQGLLIFAIDALDQVTEFVYPSESLSGATGLVRETIRYAGAITALSSYSVATVRSALADAGLTSNTNNRKSFAVYDAAERLAYSIDAVGGVVGYAYDIAGRVTKTTAYATFLVTGDLPSKAGMDAWADNAAGANDRVTRNSYSDRGELRFVVDAEGYVTRNDYDAAGRLVQVVKWSDAITATDATTISGVSGAVSGDYATTAYEYDPMDRLRSIYDSYGNRHYYGYYANGTLASDTVAYGSAGESRTLYEYDGAGRVLTRKAAYGTSAQAITSFSYNAFGDLTTTTDPNGGTTSHSYDKLGQLLSTTGGEGGVTNYAYDAFGNRVKITDPKGNATYNYHDKLGRLTASRDAEDYVTETSYTVFGDIASVTRRYNRASNAASTAARPVVTADPDDDAVTLFNYDKLGRAILTTDAEGNTERSWYNAFGDITKIQNKIGGITEYSYNKRGLLYGEYVRAPVYDYNGNAVAQGFYKNLYQYDARGNVITRTEAAGLPEQRVTHYVYDKLDRLIEKTGDQILVGRLREQSYATPTERYSYDLRGNLIQVTDAAGGRTYHYYDDLDREIASVDATGVLSTKGYDANGNVETNRTYAVRIALPATPGGPPPAAPSGDYRETSYTYDKLDRLKTTSIAGVRTGSWAGSAYATAITTITTSLDYDAVGNVVKATDGNGGVVYSYYDKAGRRTVQVDQLGYRTDWQLDGEGNVLTEIRYAVAATGYSVTSQGSVAPNAADRKTTFTYDLNGNRLTETRHGLVDVSSVDPATGSLTINPNAATSTITYGYNALGQVLSKTQGTGDVFQYEYDSAGRLTKETRPSNYDYDSGSVRAPTIGYYYDALGNVVRTAEGAHVTRYDYTAGGRLASVTDAGGAVRNYYYDVAGRRIGEVWHRLDAAGGDRIEGIGYGYDALGRLTSQSFADIHPTDWSDAGDVTEIAYDAFGEVVRRSTNGLAQDLFAYDRAGRMVASRTGDGVWRYSVYDAAGNQTLELASDGSTSVDLRNRTIDAVLAVATGNGTQAVGAGPVAGVTATITVYDSRNQAIATRQPDRQLSSGSGFADLVRTRSYNAFGEVASESDLHLAGASGGVTSYAYNTMGRLVRVTRPQVSVTGEDGVSANAAPVEVSYYDVAGRLVALQDAAGVRTLLSLVAGTGYDGGEALVATEFHADGGRLVRRYDVWGNVRQVTGETGLVTTMAYDALGRLTEQSNPGGLVDHYGYDQLGQRISHWTNVLGSGEVETTGYDRQGRIVATRAFGGDVTTTSYAWEAGIGVATLGTLGGWTETITYQNGRTAIEQADVYGHVVSRTDLGGHVFGSSYDQAGRLAAVSGNGADTSYGYYNTGLAASVTQSDGGVVTATSYGYDARGLKTSERTTRNGALIQDASASYDALGRMTSWASAETSAAPSASVNWQYDAVGNVRSQTQGTWLLNSTGVASSFQSQTWWYRYDAMNRVVTDRGVLSGGAIVRGTDGVELTYDASGRRATATSDKWLTGYVSAWVWYPEYDPANGAPPTFPQEGVTGEYRQQERSYFGEQRETYGYDAAGNLASTLIEADGYADNGNGTVTSTGVIERSLGGGSYSYDGLGRRTQQVDTVEGGAVVYDRLQDYDAKGRVWRETVTQRQGTDTVATVTENQFGDGTAGYALGAVTRSDTSGTRVSGGTSTTLPSTRTVTSYAWYDGAVQAQVDHTPDVAQSTVYRSYYTHSGTGVFQSASVQDGRPRTISVVNNALGQAIRRDEADGNAALGDPHEVWYRFDGRQIGYTGNDGTWDTSYAGSVDDRIHTVWDGPGAFRYGSTGGWSHVDFNDRLTPITTYAQGSEGGSYTVRAGDTLGGIAAQLWGDASLWYKLAAANGLTGDAPLIAGQSLSVPAGVMRNTHSASTFKPYEVGDAYGDTSPTTPKPRSPKKNKCGAFGQVLLVAVAVAVSIWAAPAAPNVWQGAIAGIAGSAASQTVGVVTGIQDKFSLKSVALAGISGGVGAALRGVELVSGLGKATTVANDVIRGALGNGLTQGIAVATGLQSKFDWAGVAVGGVVGGVTGAVGRALDVQSFSQNASVGNIANAALAGTAGAIAGAAARSLIKGTSFGDNILAALPDAIGATIGTLVASRVTSAGGMASAGAIRASTSMVGGSSLGPDGPDIVVTGRRMSDREALYYDLTHPLDTISRVVSDGLTFVDIGVESATGIRQVTLPIRKLTDFGIGAAIGAERAARSTLQGMVQLARNPGGTIQAGVLGAAGLVDRAVFASSSDLGRAVTGGARQVGDVLARGDTRAIGEAFGSAAVSAADLVLGSHGAIAATRLTARAVDAFSFARLGRVGVAAETKLAGGTFDLGVGGSQYTVRASTIAGFEGATGTVNTRAFVVHGNSKLSPRPATLYELYQVGEDGSLTFLKHGISQNPATRYSKSFMEDKRFFEVATGPRADMLALERQRVTQNPGPLNFEPWAVKARSGQ